MLDSTAAIGMFDKTLSVIGLIRDGKRRKDERTDQALFALYTALVETRAYVDELKKTKRRNRRKEYALAKLWSDASVPLRHIDRDLAYRCFLKGSYWLERDTWSQARIKRSGIELRTVFEATRELLMK